MLSINYNTLFYTLDNLNLYRWIKQFIFIFNVLLKKLNYTLYKDNMNSLYFDLLFIAVILNESQIINVNVMLYYLIM